MPSPERPEQELSRRKFIEQIGLTAALGGAMGNLSLPSLLWAADGNSGPIDCGPPPPAKPQHQTGGESFPPLPLAGHALAAEREETPAKSARLDRQNGHGTSAAGRPRTASGCNIATG